MSGSNRPRPGLGSLARAIAFIDARAGLGVTIGDIARAAGVSPRALQLTFRRHLRMTPMAYARRVRIGHAHDELQYAVPGDGASVTRIALDWGFANPSRFAGYYRSAYGRPPHDTLRSEAPDVVEVLLVHGPDAVEGERTLVFNGRD